jgi:hypothetical protein
MNFGRSVAFTFALAAVVVAAGCAAKQNDKQIAEAVQGKIYADSSITSRQINASSANGVVTLNGAVASDAERQSAAADASQVQGVRTVVNDLVVAAAAPPPAPAPATQPAASSAPAPASAPGPRRRAERRGRRAEQAAESAPAPAAPPAQPPSAAPPAPPAAPAPQAAPPPAPEAPPEIMIPAGTPIAVRMIDSVDSRNNKTGDVFHASLDSPLVANGQVVVPRGADVWGRIVQLDTSGKFKGATTVSLALTKLSVGGQTYPLSTDQYTAQSSSRSKRTAETVGGGAILGAIIGAIAGHGKGAAIGAAAGAGAGAATQEVTKAQQVKIASETRVVFHLAAPLQVTPAGS